MSNICFHHLLRYRERNSVPLCLKYIHNYVRMQYDVEMITWDPPCYIFLHATVCCLKYSSYRVLGYGLKLPLKIFFFYIQHQLRLICLCQQILRPQLYKEGFVVDGEKGLQKMREKISSSSFPVE